MIETESHRDEREIKKEIHYKIDVFMIFFYF